MCQVSQTPAPQVFRGFSVRREVWTLAGRPVDLTWVADVDALLDLPITHQRFSRNEYMPYWAQPWPSSVLLAEYLLAGRAAPAGSGAQAIELGCGVGLVGVAAGLVGWRVTACDYDVDAMAFAELNAARNGVPLVATCEMDITVERPDRPYHLVLAADVLYERRLTEPVADWIASAISGGGMALVADPARAAADEFPQRMAARGFRVQTEEVSTTAPAGLVSRGRIWTITGEHQ